MSKKNIQKLVTLYQSGDKDATIKLLDKFNNLLKNVASKYSKKVSPMLHDDLRNHAIVTFLQLTKKYDLTRGVDFLGYIKNNYEHFFTDTLEEL